MVTKKKTRAQLAEQHKLFRYSLEKESDRGCALMVSSFLDEALRDLLEQCLRGDGKLADNLFDGNGPLTTFSARINLAFGLGLISRNSTRDLHLLRAIRNEFGHVYEPINFETPSIGSRIRELETHTRPLTSNNRQIFTSCASYLMALINAEYLKHKRPEVMREIMTKQKKEEIRKAVETKVASVRSLPATLSQRIFAGEIPDEEVDALLESQANE
jgi:DNA-binding MltR family transcriptional regulator